MVAGRLLNTKMYEDVGRVVGWGVFFFLILFYVGP